MHMDLLSQLAQAAQAARELNDRIAQHRQSLKSLPGLASQNAKLQQHSMAHGMSDTNTRDTNSSQPGHLASSMSLPMYSSGLHLDDTVLCQPETAFSLTDMDSLLTPVSRSSLGERPQLQYSELESQHQDLIMKQHKQYVQRKEQIHRLKIARLESQLKEQEARCAEQAARADALAAQLEVAQSLLTQARQT